MVVDEPSQTFAASQPLHKSLPFLQDIPKDFAAGADFSPVPGGGGAAE